MVEAADPIDGFGGAVTKSWSKVDSPIMAVLSPSVTQPCPTLCDPTDSSTLGFPANYLPAFVQTHVH